MPIIRFKQSTATDIPLSLQPGEPAVRLHADRVDFYVGDAGGVPRMISGGSGEGGWNGEPLTQPLIITGTTDPIRISLRGTTTGGRSQIEMRDADGTTASAARIRHVPGTGIEFDFANTFAARIGAKGTAAAAAETIMTREKSDARFLALAGGTVNGALTLLNTGTGADNPATRGFVETSLSPYLRTSTATAAYVAKGGDTMAGQLTLVGDPTATGHAARKAYVDAVVTPKMNTADANAAFAPKSHTHTESQITDLDRLRWRGSAINTSWSKNDVVVVGGAAFVALRATSQPPPGADWAALGTGGAPQWLALTQAEYDTLASVAADQLYIITDTRRIALGAVYVADFSGTIDAVDMDMNAIEGTEGIIEPEAFGVDMNFAVIGTSGPGTAQATADGSGIDYTLDPNTDGQVFTITYSATSGGASDTATITIQITDADIEAVLSPAIGPIDDSQAASAAWLDTSMPTPSNFGSGDGGIASVLAELSVNDGPYDVNEVEATRTAGETIRFRLTVTTVRGNIATYETNVETVSSAGATVPAAFAEAGWDVVPVASSNGNQVDFVVRMPLPSLNGGSFQSISYALDGGPLQTLTTAQPTVDTTYRRTLPQGGVEYAATMFLVSNIGPGPASDVKPAAGEYTFQLSGAEGTFAGDDGIWTVEITDTADPYYVGSPYTFDSGAVTFPYTLDNLDLADEFDTTKPMVVHNKAMGTISFTTTWEVNGGLTRRVITPITTLNGVVTSHPPIYSNWVGTEGGIVTSDLTATVIVTSGEAPPIEITNIHSTVIVTAYEAPPVEASDLAATVIVKEAA